MNMACVCSGESREGGPKLKYEYYLKIIYVDCEIINVHVHVTIQWL